METRLNNQLPTYLSFASGVRYLPDRGYTDTPARLFTGHYESIGNKIE